MIALTVTMMPAIRKVVGALARLRQKSRPNGFWTDGRRANLARNSAAWLSCLPNPVEPDNRVHLKESLRASAFMSSRYGSRMDPSRSRPCAPGGMCASVPTPPRVRDHARCAFCLRLGAIPRSPRELPALQAESFARRSAQRRSKFARTSNDRHACRCGLLESRSVC